MRSIRRWRPHGTVPALIAPPIAVLLALAAAATANVIRVGMVTPFYSDVMDPECFSVPAECAARYAVPLALEHLENQGWIRVQGVTYTVEIVPYAREKWSWASADTAVEEAQAAVAAIDSGLGLNKTTLNYTTDVGDIDLIIIDTYAGPWGVAVLDAAEFHGIPLFLSEAGDYLLWQEQRKCKEPGVCFGFGIQVPYSNLPRGPLTHADNRGFTTLVIIGDSQSGAFRKNSLLFSVFHARQTNLRVIGPTVQWCEKWMNATSYCRIVLVDGQNVCRCGRQSDADALGLEMDLYSSATFYDMDRLLVEQSGRRNQWATIFPEIVDWIKDALADAEAQVGETPDVLMAWFQERDHPTFRYSLSQADYNAKMALSWGSESEDATWGNESVNSTHQSWRLQMVQWHHTMKTTDPVFGSTAGAAEAYADAYGGFMPDRVAQVLTSFSVLKAALEEHSPRLTGDLPNRRGEIRHAISKVYMETLYGMVRFDKYNMNVGRWGMLMQEFPVWNRTEMKQAIVIAENPAASIVVPQPSWASRFGCPVGTYCTGSECLNCPAGRYRDQQSPGEPQRSLTGFSPGVEHSACDVCSVGIGTTPNETGTVACGPCPDGTVNDGSSSGICENCQAGQYRDSDMEGDSCQNCPAGYYAGNISLGGKGGTKEDLCRACPVGQYSGTPGTSGCRLCPLGTHAAERGMSRCFECPKGHYCSLEGAASCSECPPGRVTLSTGSRDASLCVCDIGAYGRAYCGDGPDCSGDNTCTPCRAPWRTTHGPGSETFDECIWDLAAYLCTSGAVTLAISASLFCVAYRRLKRKTRARLEASLQQKMVSGLETIHTLQHPYMLMSANLFLKTSLSHLRDLHEVHRNGGNLVYLDTVEAIAGFKDSGVFIVFFSYQWLSWDTPGPDEAQHKAMKASLHLVAERLGRRMGEMYIWLDILSIPQRNETLKKLAVNSLYTYARQADALIIVAPDSVHVNLGVPANLETYKSRVWTRAEQLSFFSHRGLSRMFVITQDFQEVPEKWMDDVADLFEGAMTCCSREHQGGSVCDKESLVLPMLGMYFDLCISHAMGVAEQHSCAIYDEIQAQKIRIFPKTHAYVQPGGKIVKKELFGSSIARLDRMLVDKQQLLIEMHSKSALAHSTSARGGLVSNPAHNNIGVVVPSASPFEMLRASLQRGLESPGQSTTSSSAPGGPYRRAMSTFRSRPSWSRSSTSEVSGSQQPGRGIAAKSRDVRCWAGAGAGAGAVARGAHDEAVEEHAEESRLATSPRVGKTRSHDSNASGREVRCHPSHHTSASSTLSGLPCLPETPKRVVFL